jgi:transcription antitermination factor NusG
MEELKWYAVRTRSRHEKMVDTVLQRMGYETYLPLRHTRNRRRDRVAMVDLPALPGYLFVRCTMIRENSGNIKRIQGVIGLVGNVGTPTVIPDWQIKSFMVVLQNANEQWLLTPPLQKGDRVRVTRGPMKDLEGYLTRIGSRHQLGFAVEGLPFGLTVEVHEADVDKIDE